MPFWRALQSAQAAEQAPLVLAKVTPLQASSSLVHVGGGGQSAPSSHDEPLVAHFEARGPNEHAGQVGQSGEHARPVQPEPSTMHWAHATSSPSVSAVHFSMHGIGSSSAHGPSGGVQLTRHLAR